jgi:hypothetical protein
MRWGVEAALRPILVLALLVAGCAQLNPRPGPIRAMAPRPNPLAAEASLPSGRERVRQNPWLTRSWDELAPAERHRVAIRLSRQRPRPTDPTQSVWDRLGLPDRTALVFGTPIPVSPQLAPSTSMAGAD